jgi:hypothetical protein
MKSVTSASASDVTGAAPPRFDWPLAYEAEKLLRQHIAAFLEKNSFARHLAERMRNKTATDFFEWVDHIVLSAEEQGGLHKAGFLCYEGAETPNGEPVLEHPQATLPSVLLVRSANATRSLAVKPEFVADFIAAHNLSTEPEGESLSRYRRLKVWEEKGTVLEAIERHAYRGFVTAPLPDNQLKTILKAKELWHTRTRRFANDADGFRAANEILEAVIALVGRDRACELFFEEERAYWQSRNRAGRVQKCRQDSLGLGWGNHDHHTYRCSREHFADLIGFLVKLGFHRRERFYAGAEAGWGAQVLEQPMAGIVVFADVDLTPEETEIDFSVGKLPPVQKLGTVGLWVGLHGESFLEAGMHHLEARFDFELLRQQLQREGVNTMKPFSDFEFLRQAFTEGERWPVRRERAERLLNANLITREQFEQFVRDGAIGSHLENLQRHGGFKGFNQKSVSAVIAATDPRKHQVGHLPAAA